MRPPIVLRVLVSLLVVTLAVTPLHARAEEAPPARTEDADRADEAEARRAAVRARVGLYATGGGLLAGMWLTNMVGSAFAGSHAEGLLQILPNRFDPAWSSFRALGVVPLVGPWLQMAAIPSGADGTTWIGWLLIDGLAQATGLGLLFAAATTDVPDAPSLAIVPWTGPDGGGLVAIGAF
jgi:hypothetical protein